MSSLNVIKYVIYLVCYEDCSIIRLKCANFVRECSKVKEYICLLLKLHKCDLKVYLKKQHPMGIIYLHQGITLP